MRKDIEEKYLSQASILKAIAHPSRLAIIDAIKDKELCVCELQEIVGSDISTVSKHLSVLKNAGLVAQRKENNRVFYKLRYKCILSFISCIRSEEK